VDDVNRHIADDIEGAFNASKDDTACLWRSHNGTMIHLVLGREYAPSGDHFNNCTYQLLKTVIGSAVAEKHHGNVLARILETSQQIFPYYFWTPGMETSGIPFVIAPFEVNVDNNIGGANTVISPLNPERRDLHIDMLVAGVKLGAKFISQMVCSVLGVCTSPDHTEDEELEKISHKNPFEVKFDWDKAKMILSNSSIDLEYLPHLGERPNLFFMPSYDLYIVKEKKKLEWLLLVDLPGVQKENIKVYCPLDDGLEVLTHLGIVGHRSPPTYSSSQRQDTPFTRKYGSFAMTIKLHPSMNCQTLRESWVLQDGVLTIASQPNLSAERFSYSQKHFT